MFIHSYKSWAINDHLIYFSDFWTGRLMMMMMMIIIIIIIIIIRAQGVWER